MWKTRQRRGILVSESAHGSLSLLGALPTTLSDFFGTSRGPCSSSEVNAERRAGYKARPGQELLVRKEAFHASLNHFPSVAVSHEECYFAGLQCNRPGVLCIMSRLESTHFRSIHVTLISHMTQVPHAFSAGGASAATCARRPRGNRRTTIICLWALCS